MNKHWHIVLMSRKCSKGIREYKVRVVLAGARERADLPLSEWIDESIANCIALFHLLCFANRAALEAVDQPLPPRPALLIRLMLKLKISGFR